MDKVPAIIIGLDSLPGLQAARILSKHKIDVYAIARFKNHYCCRTNAYKKIYFANTQTEEFIDLLLQEGKNFISKPVLYPCTDMSVVLISKNSGKLKKFYQLVLPSEETVSLLIRKASFYEYLKKHDFLFPKTRVLRSLEDAKHAVDALKFPVIIKPSLRELAWTTNSPQKVYKIDDKEKFIRQYLACSQWTRELIVQEWIAGPESNLYSCNVYFGKNGEPLVTFVWRKIRQWPPETGVVSLGIECRNDEILRLSKAFFLNVQYRGLGHIEIKYDEVSRKYYIIEANIGRPTVFSLAEKAGVTFLYTMYCDAIGLPLPAEREQRYVNTKWINIHHDLRSAWHYMEKHELTVSQWIESLGGIQYDALLSFSDPGPFFGDLQQSLVRLAKRMGKTFSDKFF